MGFEEDLSIYFDTDFGGTTATINGSPVVGIFDETYVEISVGNVQITGLKPTFTAPTTSLSAVVKDTVVTIGSDTYKVIVAPNDSTGVTVLVMKKI